MVVTLVSLTILNPSLTPARAQATKAETLSVVDSRPLAEAADLLEDRYGWLITYEDPVYSYAGDLTDRSAPWFRGTKHHAFIPRVGRIHIAYDVSIGTRKPNDPAAVIQRLIDDHANQDNPGMFSLLQGTLSGGSPIYHLVPAKVRNSNGEWVDATPTLDALITFPAQDRTGEETLNVFCAALTQSVGIDVKLGLFPTNLMYQHHGIQEAKGESARSVLQRITDATNRKLFWRLFYGPGTNSYFLNLDILTQVVPNPYGGTTCKEVR